MAAVASTAMTDYLAIGPVPAHEDAAQVGQPDYESRAKEECLRFIDRIRAVLGPEPEGVKLMPKRFGHELGAYWEVVAEFDSGVPAAREYAYRCESDAPDTWE